MTSTESVTSSDSTRSSSSSLLWLPYVGLAVLFLIFLAGNFWCYHRRHRSRYRRKAEVIEARQRVFERRIILNKVKAKYSGNTDNDNDDIVHVSEEPSMFYANPHTSEKTLPVQSCYIELRLPKKGQVEV